MSRIRLNLQRVAILALLGISHFTVGNPLKNAKAILLLPSDQPVPLEPLGGYLDTWEQAWSDPYAQARIARVVEENYPFRGGFIEYPEGFASIRRIETEEDYLSGDAIDTPDTPASKDLIPPEVSHRETLVVFCIFTFLVINISFLFTASKVKDEEIVEDTRKVVEKAQFALIAIIAILVLRFDQVNMNPLFEELPAVIENLGES